MVISIGGVSRSGKTQLAKFLKKILPYTATIIINQDDYAYPVPDIPLINGITDWECPGSINFSLFKKDIREACSRADCVIVEGFLIYHDSELISMYDKCIFITIDKSTFLERRTNDKRWGKEPDWYLEHIWGTYQTYGQPPDTNKLLTVDGNSSQAIMEVLKYLTVDHKLS